MSHSVYSPLSQMSVPYFKSGDQTSIDTGNLSRKETDSSLKLMMKTGTNRRVSECSMKDEPDRREEVAKFIEEYKANNFKDVPVTKMRHIISMLLMEVYVENYTSYTRKVKGIWKSRPTGWPADIPYVDPNNKLRSDDGEHCCKPKKSLLSPMLMHLVTKYMNKQGENRAPADDRDRILIPHQVEDVIDDLPLDWDPIKEMLPRLGSKLAFLKERNVVDTAIFGDLCKRFVLLKNDIGACDWLEKAHSLECTIDTIKHRYMSSHSDVLASLQNVKLRGADRFIPHSAAMSPARTFEAVKEASVGETLMSTMNVNKRGLNSADNVMSLLKIDERAFSGPQWMDQDTKTHVEIEFDVVKPEQHCVVAVDNSDVSKLNIHTKTTGLTEGLIQAVQLRCVNPTPEVSNNEEKKELWMVDDQDLMLALADLPQLSELSADVLDLLGASNYANTPCDERVLNEYVNSLGARPESDPPPVVAVAPTPDISCSMSEQFHFGSVPMTGESCYHFSSYNAPATPGSSHISGQMESLYLENIMEATMDISSDQFLSSETMGSNNSFTGMPSSNIPLVVEQMEDEDDLHYTGPLMKRQCSYM